METLHIILLMAGLLAFVIGVPIMVIHSLRGGLHGENRGSGSPGFNALAELDKLVRPSAEHRIETEHKIEDEQAHDGD